VIDADAHNHDIVHDSEAALAANPLAISIPQTTVGQNCSLIEGNTSFMESLGLRELRLMKEVPRGPVDDFIRSVTENVNNRI